MKDQKEETTEKVSFAQVMRSLHAVQLLYPRGVSRREISQSSISSQVSPEQNIRSVGTGRAGLLILTVASEQPQLYSGPQGELLKAAIEKGLKLTTNDVLFITASEDCTKDQLATYLTTVKLETEVKSWLLLGESAANLFSQVSKVKSVSYLFVGKAITSKSLTEIASSEPAKRAFWQDLKSILSVLGQ